MTSLMPAVAAADSLSVPSGVLPWFAVTIALAVASSGLFIAAAARRSTRSPTRRPLLAGGGLLAVLAMVAFCRFVEAAVSPPAVVYVVFIAGFVVTAAVSYARWIPGRSATRV